MAFDQTTRNRLQKFVSSAREILSDEFTKQLQALYGIDPKQGTISEVASLKHLDDQQRQIAVQLRETFDHYLANTPGKGDKDRAKQVLDRIVREQAFTVLNRLAALRMAEARGFLIESIGNGQNSQGFQLYKYACETALGETGDAYREYLFALFDEFALDLAVLFDRNSSQGRLFPRDAPLQDLLNEINHAEIEALWAEDETIGWIYQYFNSQEERKKMRAESQAPRNSRELAVRNQFFTPRYVVEFLTDNTLGRVWFEMTQGNTALVDSCRYLVRRPTEVFLEPDEKAPNAEASDSEALSQDELLKQPVYIPHRPLKDPRSIRMLDPACGSMHFGLYAFDLFERIYLEAWQLEEKQGPDAFIREAGQQALHCTFDSLDVFTQQIPKLIIEHNIHGVDIDPRAAQIAGLSLWQRAQRAWHKLGINPQQRPTIVKSNIVCAEPMPGEKALLQDFTSELNPPVLGQLLEVIFEKMQLAGEAGTLLKIEEEIKTAIHDAREQWLIKSGNNFVSDMFQVELDAATPQSDRGFDLRGIDDETFWDSAEQRILQALSDYSERAESNADQKRLFAEDAAKGFAFIDLCRKRFDAILMNPPFGATSNRTESFSFKNPASCKNLFSAFVVRCRDFTCPINGKIGVISDRSFLLKESYNKYRTWLYNDAHLETLIDLGWDVLDANVEVCGYVIDSNKNDSNTLFINLSKDDLIKKELELLKVLSGNFLGEDRVVFLTYESFRKLPDESFSYWLPKHLLLDFARRESIGSKVGRAARGMSSGKVEFACRLTWEVPNEFLGEKQLWNPVNVGGGRAAYFRAPFMAFRFEPNWGAMKYFPGFSLKNTDLYWQPAIGWGKRTDLLSTQLLPRGMITAEDGQLLVPTNMEDIWTLLGYLNSKYSQVSINSICGGHKGPGYLSSIPFDDELLKNEDIGSFAKKITQKLIEISTCDETSIYFISPFKFGDNIFKIRDELNSIYTSINSWMRKVDYLVYESLGKGNEEVSEMSQIVSETLEVDRFFGENLEDISKRILSFGFGVAIGRWSPDKSELQIDQPLLDMPRPYTTIASREDGGHQRPTSIIEILIGSSSGLDLIIKELENFSYNESAIQNLLNAVGGEQLENYFTKPKLFFDDHLDLYSRSRRKAPIYWPLQTASSSYTLWIYYHRLNEQTLYTCVNDFVEPKLEQVEKDFNDLRSKSARSSKHDKELEKLNQLASELRDFRDELLRLAKFWKPNLNDGVQITAAPLWKLFQHKAWQKKLKETWESLEKGDYDWAHLACCVWPKRVLEKCHQDRSLAIAHGVEDIFWNEIEVPIIRRGRDTGETKLDWHPKDLTEGELSSLIENVITERGL